MPKPRVLVLLAAAFATALVLAACGGDDDDDGGGEEDAKIIATVEVSVLSTDPADCTRLQTQQFLEQSNFSTGEEAVRDCEEDAADTEDDPDSIDVENIEVDGTDATADVAFTGGLFDGSTVAVELVKEGEQWKLNRIADVSELNLEAFQENFVAQLRADGEIPTQIADCMAQAIQETTQDEIEQLLVGGTEQDLQDLFGECIPTG